MLSAALAIGGLGLVAGLGLGIASKLFYVYVDPKIIEVEECLPGANCGGCGSAGCSSAAAAMVSGKLAPNACVAGGADVAVKVAAILGMEVGETEPVIAQPGCKYGLDAADLKYAYGGVMDCRAAMLLGGGAKECSVGCLGLGTCVAACPFGALTLSPSGLPVVNADLCTGCGTCERVCPKHIIRLSSNSEKIEHLYQDDECTAPCQRTCPAEIRIPDYIRAIAEGDYGKAVEVIKQSNPFPLVCGRICPHPCEYECRRGMADEPININHLKRFAADYEMQSGSRVVPPKAPDTGKKAAVIGGGVEGLTAAYFLARLGHHPTVFEAQSELGGILRKVIADYRLPVKVLDWEIEGILETGVTARTGVTMGRDFSLAGLFKEGYQAVALAAGGWDSMILREKGKPEVSIPGNLLLMPLAMAMARGENLVPEKKSVAVVGHSKAAVDMAVKLRGDGKRAVTLVAAKTREAMQSAGIDVASAEGKGVVFEFGTVPTGLLGEEDRLTGLEIMNAEPAADSAGELARPCLIPESEKILQVDWVITSLVRYPELIFVPVASEQGDAESEEETSGPLQWRTVDAYKQPSPSGQIGLFDPSSTVSDYKAAVEAIGAGRRLARSVHQSLKGQPVTLPERMIRPDSCLLNVDQVSGISPAPRRQPESVELGDEVHRFTEEELGLTQEMAKAEAARCLDCGLICYRRDDSAA